MDASLSLIIIILMSALLVIVIIKIVRQQHSRNHNTRYAVTPVDITPKRHPLNNLVSLNSETEKYFQLCNMNRLYDNIENDLISMQAKPCGLYIT
jgi:hypothetical protein